MTRQLSRGAAVLFLLAAVANCDALKKKLGGGADAGADGAVVTVEVPDSAPPPVAGPLAANEDDVARFPDETKIEVPATVQRPSNVREVPAVGKVIAALAKGAAVTQIAQRDKFFLVTFDDAKTPGRKLMGWVINDAFVPVAAADAGVKPLTCTPPDIALFSDSAFCGRACAKDSECPAGQVCKGSATRLKNGKPSDSVTVCSAAVTHDAGAPHAADAGGAFIAPTPGRLASLFGTDAGAKPVDAGAAPTPAAPAGDLDVVEPVSGKCATGFFLVPKDKKCHRLCPGFTECKQAATQRCVGCGAGIKVCSAVNGLCQ